MKKFWIIAIFITMTISAKSQTSDSTALILIDIQYLGERLHSYPFLKETLREIPEDIDAISMYRRMNFKAARDSIETLLLLTRR